MLRSKIAQFIGLYDSEHSLWIAGVVGIGVAGSLLAYLYINKKGNSYARTRSLNRLPGPIPVPIIGNVLDFPKNRWYEKFSELQKEYGDVILFDLMGTHFLVINSLEDAEELANKRSSVYSGRPYHAMITDLMEFNWGLIMRQPDKDFYEQRKLFRKVVGPQAVSTYDHLVNEEAGILVEKLSGFAGDPFPKIESSIATVVIKLAYGEKVYREYGQEIIDLNTANIEHSAPIFTTFYAVSVFTWLRYVPEWVPGAHFQKLARIGKEILLRIRNWIFELILKDIEDGVAEPSVTTAFLGDPEITRENLKDALAILYGGAVDTTSTSILSYFYDMAIHPEIQRKVQKEIDGEMGRDHDHDHDRHRIPSVEDSLRMEYLLATWKESLRLSPPAPLGLPHTAQVEDSWKGYYIPKNTVVNFNIGFMMRDPRIWGSDAEEYKPERLLGENGKNLPDIASIAFGFGKRICPGRLFAEREARTVIAAVLSVYDILPVDGETIPQPITFRDSLIRGPEGFRCQFRPRVF